ncbi:hypothetical protein Syun_027637 [Stephania yunnanensis]|uniref:RNA polymerase Rpb2 domain-containing protein n=1 Tax=Stephania yunnanensis TaxID=152371 RepID=A0AAP0EG02_9MAGN
MPHTKPLGHPLGWCVEIKRDQQHGEVRIFTDAGRILRPLLVVENLKKIKRIKGHYNFLSLLEDGIIESWLELKKRRTRRIAWGLKSCSWEKETNYH